MTIRLTMTGPNENRIVADESLRARVWKLAQAGVVGPADIGALIGVQEAQVPAWLLSKEPIDAVVFAKLEQRIAWWEEITPVQTMLRKSDMVVRLRELAKEAIDLRADQLAVQVYRASDAVRAQVRRVLQEQGDRAKSRRKPAKTAGAKRVPRPRTRRGSSG